MNYIAISGDQYFEHHGVKGMKWGVRRGRELGKNGRKANKLYFQRKDRKNRYGETVTPRAQKISRGDQKRLTKLGGLDSNHNMKDYRKVKDYMDMKRNVTVGTLLAGFPGAVVAAGGTYAYQEVKRRSE